MLFSNDCILRIFTCVFIMLCYYVVVDTSIRLAHSLSFVSIDIVRMSGTGQQCWVEEIEAKR